MREYPYLSLVLDGRGEAIGEVETLSRLGDYISSAIWVRAAFTDFEEDRLMSQPKSELSVVNPNAAGIDLGADYHWVSVPEGCDEQCIRRFGCFTADLYAMAEWLKGCGIETVAMEATGVYWIPVFQILETEGFEVKLVNARHVKTVPGRKSDVLDCQWLRQLHSYGLLAGSFRPDDQVCVLHSYIRQRGRCIIEI